jgi:hypothetical protein
MILHKFSNPNDRRIYVVVEDDDTVAYGYICSQEEITGVVWLYNVDEPTSRVVPDRSSDDLAPLADTNTAKNPQFAPIRNTEEISCVWSTRESDGANVCNIFIRGSLHAILIDGENPGRCVLATQDDRVARRLTL